MIRDMKAHIEKWSIPEPNTGCWLWLRCLSKSGYGRVNINGKIHFAHRISFSAFNGEISPGKFILHKCDTPACVNPNHLYQGDQADNMKDRQNNGKYKYTHCRRGHSFIGTNLIIENRSDGYSRQVCRQCRCERRRKK